MDIHLHLHLIFLQEHDLGSSEHPLEHWGGYDVDKEQVHLPLFIVVPRRHTGLATSLQTHLPLYLTKTAPRGQIGLAVHTACGSEIVVPAGHVGLLLHVQSGVILLPSGQRGLVMR